MTAGCLDLRSIMVMAHWATRRHVACKSAIHGKTAGSFQGERSMRHVSHIGLKSTPTVTFVQIGGR